jgi:hypothetical protein
LDPASAATRFQPSAWLTALAASERPMTLNEVLATSSFEKRRPGTMRLSLQLSNQWQHHLMRMGTPQEEASRLVWLCMEAPNSDAVLKTLCAADLAYQQQSKVLAQACATVMMRTLEADTAALDRITSEMRQVGATEEAVKHFTEEIFITRTLRSYK